MLFAATLLFAGSVHDFSMKSIAGEPAPLSDWKGKDIKWNFTKFLVDKNGKVIARFEPQTVPDAPDVIAAVEQAHAK